MASAFSYSNNKMSGGLQGAGTGAAVGAAFGPWGAAIGGGIGLVAGWFGAAAEEEDKENRRKILEQLSQDLDISYNQIEQTFEEFYKNYTPGGTQEDAIEAAEKIRNFDSVFGQRLAEYGLDDPEKMKFSYDKSVEDFINPYMGNVIEASNRAVQHSAAGAGLGRSTGAAKAIAENTAKQYNDIYNTAVNEYGKDRAQSYQEFQGYLDQANKMLNTLTSNDQWGIEQQRSLGDDFLNWMGQKTENLANLQKDRTNAKMQVELANANI